MLTVVLGSRPDILISVEPFFSILFFKYKCTEYNVHWLLRHHHLNRVGGKGGKKKFATVSIYKCLISSVSFLLHESVFSVCLHVHCALSYFSQACCLQLMSGCDWTVDVSVRVSRVIINVMHSL